MRFGSEFRDGDDSYGINVAAVRELLPYRTVQPMPVFRGNGGVVTEIAKTNGTLIAILDFGRIKSDVNPNSHTREGTYATA